MPAIILEFFLLSVGSGCFLKPWAGAAGIFYQQTAKIKIENGLEMVAKRGRELMWSRIDKTPSNRQKLLSFTQNVQRHRKPKCRREAKWISNLCSATNLCSAEKSLAKIASVSTQMCSVTPKTQKWIRSKIEANFAEVNFQKQILLLIFVIGILGSYSVSKKRQWPEIKNISNQ